MLLSGWKEIAQYLRSSVRTVQRWEGEGLPIIRPRGGTRTCGRVYGTPRSLDQAVPEWPLQFLQS
jgi:hypothetical protein